MSSNSETLLRMRFRCSAAAELATQLVAKSAARVSWFPLYADGVVFLRVVARLVDTVFRCEHLQKRSAIRANADQRLHQLDLLNST